MHMVPNYLLTTPITLLVQYLAFHTPKYSSKVNIVLVMSNPLVNIWPHYAEKTSDFSTDKRLTSHSYWKILISQTIQLLNIFFLII